MNSKPVLAKCVICNAVTRCKDYRYLSLPRRLKIEVPISEINYYVNYHPSIPKKNIVVFICQSHK